MKTGLSQLMSLLGFTTSQVQKSDRFPKDSFSILQAKKANGGLVILMANYAYKNYRYKDDFIWYLSILVEIRDKNLNGHPTNKEAKVLNQFEDRIHDQLKLVGHIHFVGRSMTDSRRELMFYLSNPEKTNEVLQAIVNDSTSVREIEYEMKEDKTWENVDYFLNK